MNPLRTPPRYADIYDEAEVHCQNEGQGPSQDEIEAAHRSKLDAVAEAGAKEAYCRATGMSGDDFDRMKCSPTQAIERLVREREEAESKLASAAHWMNQAFGRAFEAAYYAGEFGGLGEGYPTERSALAAARSLRECSDAALHAARIAYNNGPQGPEVT